jgi:hypothetical protein
VGSKKEIPNLKWETKAWGGIPLENNFYKPLHSRRNNVVTEQQKNNENNYSTFNILQKTDYSFFFNGNTEWICI